MNITNAFSFLVHPAKSFKEQPTIGGIVIPPKGKLFDMLSSLFERSDEECKIDICFTPKTDGTQHNDRRDEIIELLKEPCIEKAKVLAARLQSVSTNRSGLGLLFLVLGENDGHKKMYLSRFPADFGILAEENKQTLRVESLEKVFMRNAFAYKAVVYEGQSTDTGFWKGKAIDKQINNNIITISDYWIRDFLLSDFSTTPAAGTRRLAVALRGAMDNTDNLQIKEEIAASARLARNLDGKSLTINDFANRFSFSDETKKAVFEKLKSPSLQVDRFEFTKDEFEKHLPYRSIELNNGAILTATVPNFDKCFEKKPLADKPGIYEYKTSGSIINERLRKSK
jgi:hypothetical protein